MLLLLLFELLLLVSLLLLLLLLFVSVLLLFVVVVAAFFFFFVIFAVFAALLLFLKLFVLFLLLLFAAFASTFSCFLLFWRLCCVFFIYFDPFSSFGPLFFIFFDPFSSFGSLFFHFFRFIFRKTVSFFRSVFFLKKTVFDKDVRLEIYFKDQKKLGSRRQGHFTCVTLVPNSQHDQKDVLITESRKSDDCENEVQKHRRTCSSSRVDFRIPSIPHSTVEKVETNREETVRR